MIKEDLGTTTSSILSHQPTGAQRARDAVMSSKPTPVYEQAECFPECDDAHCPYTHFGMWRVGDKTFYSLEEAERASIEAAS